MPISPVNFAPILETSGKEDREWPGFRFDEGPTEIAHPDLLRCQVRPPVDRTRQRHKFLSMTGKTPVIGGVYDQYPITLQTSVRSVESRFTFGHTMFVVDSHMCRLEAVYANPSQSADTPVITNPCPWDLDPVDAITTSFPPGKNRPIPQNKIVRAVLLEERCKF